MANLKPRDLDEITTLPDGSYVVLDDVTGDVVGKLLLARARGFPGLTSITSEASFPYTTNYTAGTATTSLVDVSVTLTGDQQINLATTGAQPGFRHRFMRSGGGDFDLTISGFGAADNETIVLAQDQYVEVEFASSHWRKIGVGRLTHTLDGVLGNVRYEEATVTLTGAGPYAFELDMRIKSHFLDLDNASGDIDTITFANVAASGLDLVVLVIQGGATLRTVESTAWPADVLFRDGSPPDTSALAQGDRLEVQFTRSKLQDDYWLASFATLWDAP